MIVGPAVRLADTPEDVSKLVCDKDRISRTRKPDLRRLLRKFSECLIQSREEILGEQVTHRSLRSCSVSIAQTFNSLSSPAVAR